MCRHYCHPCSEIGHVVAMLTELIYLMHYFIVRNNPMVFLFLNFCPRATLDFEILKSVIIILPD